MREFAVGAWGREEWNKAAGGWTAGGGCAERRSAQEGAERNHLFTFVRNCSPLIHDTPSRSLHFHGTCTRTSPLALIPTKKMAQHSSWEKAERRIRTAIKQTSTLLNLKQLRSLACQLNISSATLLKTTINTRAERERTASSGRTRPRSQPATQKFIDLYWTAISTSIRHKAILRPSKTIKSTHYSSDLHYFYFKRFLQYGTF